MADQSRQNLEEHHTEITKETDQPVKNPMLTGAVRAILVILLVLAVIGLIGFLFYRSRNKDDTQTPNTADQIRDSFNPPTSTAPSFIPPAPNQGFSEGPNPGATSTPPAGNGNRQSQNVQPSPSPASPQRITPRQPAPANPPPVVYNNPGMGFGFSLPGNWTVDDKRDPGRVVFFDRNTGQLVGYVEMYNNVSGHDLDSLQRMLQGSPMVTGISPITLASLPALAYSASNAYPNNIAAIYNNRVYYLHGSIANPDMAARFRFL